MVENAYSETFIKKIKVIIYNLDLNFLQVNTPRFLYFFFCRYLTLVLYKTILTV